VRRRIYIESTIPSFYYELRSEAEMVARREWTRDWWLAASSRDELVTSEAVLEELGAGEHPHRMDCLAMVADLPLLAFEPAVAETVEAYIAHQLMPRDPAGDALHLALASHYRCDFLVTWNCRHLANANKFDHIRRINGILGLFVPALVTPLELLGETDDEAS
jgi:predicted nucleic acid-binding protein